MKKVLLILVFAVFGMLSAQAQEASFGITAGYTNITGKVNDGNLSVSNSEAGFYVGALVDLSISEAFHIQPEVLYAHADDASFLYIPILAKYYIADSGFQLMAGPQANLSLEETIDGINSFGLDITAGIGYDINENFFVDARYSFEVTNRISDGPNDVTARINTLHVGVGYKF